MARQHSYHAVSLTSNIHVMMQRLWNVKMSCYHVIFMYSSYRLLTRAALVGKSLVSVDPLAKNSRDMINFLESA